jgi:hypothetical protein
MLMVLQRVNESRAESWRRLVGLLKEGSSYAREATE